MMSLDTPLAARSDARPMRKECEEYNCVGKPIARMALVKIPLNWLLVRGAPLTCQKEYRAWGGLMPKYCLTALTQQRVGLLAAGIRRTVGAPAWFVLETLIEITSARGL